MFKWYTGTTCIYFGTDSLLHWQPVKRPEKWFSVGSTSALTDDSGQVVLSPL